MIQVMCNGKCSIDKTCMVHGQSEIQVTSYGSKTFGTDDSVCTLCGSRGLHNCPAIKQSHGMDFESENKHLDEDKAWGEFLEWVKENTIFNYESIANSDINVGVLIAYLRTKKQSHKLINFGSLTVEILEKEVRSLEPVDEVEELANELYLSGGGSGKLTTPGGIEYWETIARKAIEIVKGKA